MNWFIPFGIIIASLHSDINACLGQDVDDNYTFTNCSWFLVLHWNYMGPSDVEQVSTPEGFINATSPSTPSPLTLLAQSGYTQILKLVWEVFL